MKALHVELLPAVYSATLRMPTEQRVFTRSLPVPKWRNWQTRVVQVHVLARVWGFESLLRHQCSLNSTSSPSFDPLRVEDLSILRDVQLSRLSRRLGEYELVRPRLQEELRL